MTTKQYMAKMHKFEVFGKQKGVAALGATLFVYALGFYLVWSLVELFLASEIALFQSDWVKEGVLKQLVWTLPAVYLISRYANGLFVSPKELFRGSVDWVKYLPWFVAVAVLVGIGAMLFPGDFDSSVGRVLGGVAIALSVAVAEELVFRGWLLNATIGLWGRSRLKLAVFVNAALFLVVHFPVWLRNGEFVGMFASFSFLTISALGILFAAVFIRSRSIWVPIALHAQWNFMIFVLL